MRKQTIHYTTPLDALIAITKRLGLKEGRHNIESEEFYYRYQKGEMGDDAFIMEWARDYQDYLNLRQEIADVLSKPSDRMNQTREI